MIKRTFDFVVSTVVILLLSPVFLLTMLAVWLQDFQNPFYVPLRMGRGMKPFKMYKFRSMVVNADKQGGTSTSSNDMRVTGIGKIIRRFKLDELSQLINVFLGDMSLVGPRPQVISHVNDCYTEQEKHLLDVRPGITDISSIVFSDEGDILKDTPDPDLGYNQLIRPWKSKLGIFYINHQSFLLDFKLIMLTVVAIISKDDALKSINKILIQLKAEQEIIEVAKRKNKLVPTPPPGSSSVITNPDGRIN
ncbi:MAG: sugar transferase [Bacteroidota bacterium]